MVFSACVVQLQPYGLLHIICVRFIVLALEGLVYVTT